MMDRTYQAHEVIREGDRVIGCYFDNPIMGTVKIARYFGGRGDTWVTHVDLDRPTPMVIGDTTTIRDSVAMHTKVDGAPDNRDGADTWLTKVPTFG